VAGPTGPTTRNAERRGRTSSARPEADPGPRPPAAAQRRSRLRLRLRGRLLLLVLFLSLALGGFAAWVLYGSNWVLVERVSVSGNRVLTKEQIRAAADVPVGVPLLSVDRAAAERRLTDRLPRVAQADVVRAWPHGIGLKVTERKPELAMKEDGKFVEVDAEGVRFAVVPKQPEGVPLLVMEVHGSAGLRHFGSERLRREAVSVAAALPKSVARDTRTVRVRSYDSITLELTDGRTVLWGSSEHKAAKGKSLTALMKAAEDARHFDVSVPSAPAASGS
jgi:cell division protein FtsQ